MPENRKEATMLDLQTGDIIAIRGKGIISEAIEEVTNSRYSHICGYVGNRQLIEAEGFRKTGYADVSEYKGCADVFRCISMTREQRENVLKQALFNVGGHYDWMLLPWEFIRYVTGIMLPYREPPKARICSVLWAGIYQDAGINLCPGIRYPTPAEVAESKLLVKIGSY